MKVVASSALLLNGVLASKDAYNVPATPYVEPVSMYAYGEQPGSSYGYSPYAPESYGPQTEEFVEPVYPQHQKPHPFVDYPADVVEEGIRLPHLGQSHCFLQGAPWTSCGRRSLTSYFLEQCMSFYYNMATNVDGICGKEVAPTAAPVEGSPFDTYDAYATAPTEAAAVVSPYYPTTYGVPTEAATEAATEPTIGYSGAIIDAYQKERCLQNAFVSITAATVMCLTENMIRIKFIEHYAKDAATNPIEGPILYLKKLHTFIENVLLCNDHEAKHNYPNLWLEFNNNEGALTYNPNAPFEIVDGSVQLPDATSEASAGFEDTIVDSYFICNNHDDLPWGDTYYTSDAGNPHYSAELIDECSARTSKALHKIGRSVAKKECKYANQEANEEGETIGPASQRLTDMTLRGLYDGVNPVTRRTMSSFRVRSIAELAVQNAGVLGQPILEGFGIMYFCAFYACKANNKGDVEGTCLPKFDSDVDFHSLFKEESLNALSEKVDYCLAKKWITKDDIAMDSKVGRFNKKADRSYLCMAEYSVVSFFKMMTEDLDEESAWDLVYFRHMATEKCYEGKSCKKNRKLYKFLKKALVSLDALCEERQSAYHLAKTSAEENMGLYQGSPQ